MVKVFEQTGQMSFIRTGQKKVAGIVYEQGGILILRHARLIEVDAPTGHRQIPMEDCRCCSVNGQQAICCVTPEGKFDTLIYTPDTYISECIAAVGGKPYIEPEE